jgi:alpha-beta hydrolase superfamily lysophospholipase
MEDIYKLEKLILNVDSQTQFMIEHYIDSNFSSTIIFIHGFNDYHYNGEIVDYFISNKMNVIRLTLRNYGLLKRNKPLFYFTDLTDYFYEIDSTFEFIMSKTNLALHSVSICAHSTGGLTSIIYSQYGKYKKEISKLILNSPFVDLYFGNDIKSDLMEFCMETIISSYGYF